MAGPDLGEPASETKQLRPARVALAASPNSGRGQATVFLLLSETSEDPGPSGQGPPKSETLNASAASSTHGSDSLSGPWSQPHNTQATSMHPSRGDVNCGVTRLQRGPHVYQHILCPGHRMIQSSPTLVEFSLAEK